MKFRIFEKIFTTNYKEKNHKNLKYLQKLKNIKNLTFSMTHILRIQRK